MKTIMPFLIGALVLVLPVRGKEPCRAGGQRAATIYMDERFNSDLTERGRAIYVATRAFRNIGVELTWRIGTAPPLPEMPGCGGEVIELQIDENADPRVGSNALGYATPMRSTGTRIHIFHNRVSELSSKVPNLLGYVMAHEIGHILEGGPHHAPDGILKARWGGGDYNLMASFELRFSADDAARIGNHMSRRLESLTVAAGEPAFGGK